MDTTSLKITRTITCVYGSFSAGDIARGIPATYAKHLVEDLGVAEYINPPAATPTPIEPPPAIPATPEPAADVPAPAAPAAAELPLAEPAPAAPTAVEPPAADTPASAKPSRKKKDA